MKLRIAILDDDASAARFAAGIAKEWAEKAGHDAALALFSSAEEFLFRAEEEEPFDLLLLDIEMGEINGVSLAKRVRARSKEVQIVFITGYMEYIADGYDVEALHYLVKPVRAEKLCAVLDRAAERLRRNERALLLKMHGETVRVPLYEIEYVEVLKNYVTVHAGEEYSVKKTLGELEKSMDDRFFRTGRSFLVNLRAIRKVTRKEIFLRSGAVLPLPRGMYEPLNRAMIRYL